ncbi:hypothetical protein R84B8_00516 [Treponema sp. R8-4-B8]
MGSGVVVRYLIVKSTHSFQTKNPDSSLLSLYLCVLRTDGSLKAA